MPWDLVTLNDGHTIPGIAFQAAFMNPSEEAEDQLRQAFDLGFRHIDIPAYFISTAIGKALQASIAGHPRSSFFVTTQWLRGKDSEAEIALKKDLKATQKSKVQSPESEESKQT
ncbi:Aldo/keto reductase [Mycena venus]|uniref:Aldo/keto reductase n=1 Tax=Mycena venus TaxID=2733690 RepID=A0A8H6XZL2_9AGAR|nr:Aldo/keto reductase [Mycena venus]